MPCTHEFLQEASKDLKSMLNDKPIEEEESHKPKRVRTKDARGTASESTRGGTASHPEVPAPDSDLSSPGGQSEMEESAQASSEDNDDDLFGGKFAIKDKDADHGGRARGDRFGALPRKVAKILDNFEEEVLNSLPKDLSE